jgi:CRP-like cAMP-binding protein
LIDGLPRPDQARLLALGEWQALEVGQILAEPGAKLAHAIFPSSGMLSLTDVGNPGRSLVLDLIGCEGMLGTNLSLDMGRAPLRATVLGIGKAWRIEARLLTALLKVNGPLTRSLERYLFYRMGQLGRGARCASFHSIESRLARWLLSCQDRMGGESLQLTHTVLAQTLGVRRSTITIAAIDLQKRGVLSYSRGAIQLRSRDGLEKASCACHVQAVASYKRCLLKPPARWS